MWKRLRKAVFMVMGAVLYFWPFTFWVAGSLESADKSFSEALFIAYILTLIAIPLVALIFYAAIIIPLIFLAEWIVTGDVYERYDEYYLDPRGPIKRIIKKLKEKAEERDF